LWTKKTKIHLVVFLPLQKIPPLVKCARNEIFQGYFPRRSTGDESSPSRDPRCDPFAAGKIFFALRDGEMLISMFGGGDTRFDIFLFCPRNGHED
jgi:hypothetical protein